MTHSIKEFFLQLSVHHDNSYKLGGNMTHSAYTHQSKNLDIPLHSRPQWTLLCCHLQSLSEATFIMHPFVWGPQWYSLHQNTLAYTQAFQFCHLVTVAETEYVHVYFLPTLSLIHVLFASLFFLQQIRTQTTCFWFHFLHVLLWQNIVRKPTDPDPVAERQKVV